MDVRIFVVIIIFQTVDPGTWYPEYSLGGGNLTYLNGVSDVFTAQLGKKFHFSFSKRTFSEFRLLLC